MPVAISMDWKQSANGEFRTQVSTMAGVLGQYVITFQALPNIAIGTPSISTVKLKYSINGQAATTYTMTGVAGLWTQMNLPLGATETASYSFEYTRANTGSSFVVAPCRAFGLADGDGFCCLFV